MQPNSNSTQQALDVLVHSLTPSIFLLSLSVRHSAACRDGTWHLPATECFKSPNEAGLTGFRSLGGAVLSFPGWSSSGSRGFSFRDLLGDKGGNGLLGRTFFFLGRDKKVDYCNTPYTSLRRTFHSPSHHFPSRVQGPEAESSSFSSGWA